MADSVLRKQWQTMKALDPEITTGRHKKLDLGPTLDRATAAAVAWQKKEREASAALEACAKLWAEAEKQAATYRAAITDPDLRDEVGDFQAKLTRTASGWANLVADRKTYVAGFTKGRV